MVNRSARILRALIAYIIVYLIASFYGVVFVFQLIVKWITSPPMKTLWGVKAREVPPACLSDPQFGHHRYVQVKNVKLHYVEKGDKSKPLMLCLHGFPEFWYSWRHQLREFSDDYWVVAVDMRGYGDSEKPAGRDNYKIPHLVADVKNLISALGKQQCTLVAHDWGGSVAWHLMLLEPHLVVCYVIMNSSHPLAFRKVLSSSLSQFRKSWYLFFFRLPWLPELKCRMSDLAFLMGLITQNQPQFFLSEEDIEAFKFTFGKPVLSLTSANTAGALTPPIHYYRSINPVADSNCVLREAGRKEDFPPGLILYGEDDPFLDFQVQKESARLVKNAAVVSLPGATHFLQQHSPAAVNREMRHFLRSLPSSHLQH